MSDFREYLNEQLNDPELRSEYEKLKKEYAVSQAIIVARKESHLSQEELAKKSGLRQSNISRIESGAASPNVSTLTAIAKGLGKELHIEFR